jgi:ABC-type Zn2+ transport system substrate-binding protein/surface adhesin
MHKSKQLRENFPLAVFLSFSVFILWKMEAQLDVMRKKVIVQKSIKQMEIEKENELIERALRDNKFEDNIQIQEVEKQNKYKFEDYDDDREKDEDDDEEGEGDINTKSDIFRNLEPGNEKEIPKIMKEEFENNKNFKFGDYSEYEDRFRKTKARSPEDEELYDEDF